MNRVNPYSETSPHLRAYLNVVVGVVLDIADPSRQRKETVTGRDVVDKHSKDIEKSLKYTSVRRKVTYMQCAPR